jgi:tetratricopeptide (TPR) repeat protein
MSNGSTTSGIQRLLSAGLMLLLLSSTVSRTFGHESLQEKLREITLQIRQDPSNSQLYSRRGEIYRINQHWNPALADFRMALKLDATAAGVELGLGRTLLEQGSPQQAMSHLNLALVQQPGDVRTLVTRAKAYRALDMPLAAAADYSHAIEYFPDPGKPLPEYYLERARAYAAEGGPHIGTALLGLDEGMQVLGNIRTLALYAVELEKGRGNLDAALVRLDHILASASRKEFLLLERGDILVTANRHVEARQDFLAAQAAITALPPRHRHTRSIQQLATALTTRLQSSEQQVIHGQ